MITSLSGCLGEDTSCIDYLKLVKLKKNRQTKADFMFRGSIPQVFQGVRKYSLRDYFSTTKQV